MDTQDQKLFALQEWAWGQSILLERVRMLVLLRLRGLPHCCFCRLICCSPRMIFSFRTGLSCTIIDCCIPYSRTLHMTELSGTTLWLKLGCLSSIFLKKHVILIWKTLKLFFQHLMNVVSIHTQSCWRSFYLLECAVAKPAVLNGRT